MTEQLAARLAEVLPYAAVSTVHAVTTADVARERWVEAVLAVRDDDLLDGSFFDVLLAVDEHPAGFDVVVRLWSVGSRHGFHLRTRCPREDARIPSLTGAFGGAAWHEREAAEMLGIAFEGHPALTPLLLPDGLAGQHPLRKERVLVARAGPWPGAVDPADRPGRAVNRRLRPLGSPPPALPAAPLPQPGPEQRP